MTKVFYTINQTPQRLTVIVVKFLARARARVRMGWKAEYLDAVLVPSGLLIMFFYHLHLLRKHKVDERKHKVDEHSQDSESTTTAMAHDNHYRRRWVVDTLKVTSPTPIFPSSFLLTSDFSISFSNSVFFFWSFGGSVHAFVLAAFWVVFCFRCFLLFLFFGCLLFSM